MWFQLCKLNRTLKNIGNQLCFQAELNFSVLCNVYKFYRSYIGLPKIIRIYKSVRVIFVENLPKNSALCVTYFSAELNCTMSTEKINSSTLAILSLFFLEGQKHMFAMVRRSTTHLFYIAEKRSN